MGMDVSGRNPCSPEGEYFRANVWSWAPIRALIEDLCSDLVSEEVLRSMAFNSGAGPKDQETCTEMANRFEQWMEHHTEGFVLECEGSMRMTPEGRLVSPEELAENPDMETVSPYEVGDSHLKEWVAFLRSCGGFEVW